MVSNSLDTALQWLMTETPILAFTGAGLSTGSGIPDFRGPQGVWTRRQPVYFEEFLASEKKRIEYWEQKLEDWEAYRNAQPNQAHQALAELDRAGRMNMLVTQNIDGLHHAAGHNPQRILEIHGTNRLIECLTCGRQSQPAPAFQAFLNTRQCPRCECGGLLKSATISFGQSVSSELLARASQAVEDAALVLAAGSTLSVQPAASIPLAAVRQGKPYLVINQGPTDHDDMATVRIEGDVSTILPELIRKTLRLS